MEKKKYRYLSKLGRNNVKNGRVDGINLHKYNEGELN